MLQSNPSPLRGGLSPTVDSASQSRFSFDRAAEICKDPQGPVFQAVVDALGSHIYSRPIDASVANSIIRLALRAATPEVYDALTTSLRSFGSDAEHPYRASDVATLLYDSAKDPPKRRELILEYLQAEDPGVHQKGMLFVLENFQGHLTNGNKALAFEELQIYMPHLIAAVGQLKNLAFHRADLTAMGIIEAASKISAAEVVKAILMAETRALTEMKGDRQKLSHFLDLGYTTAKLSLREAFLPELLNCALREEYGPVTIHMLRNFGAQAVEAALDTVLAKPDPSKHVGALGCMLLNLGTHTLDWTTAWCERSPEQRLGLALVVVETFGLVHLESFSQTPAPHYLLELARKEVCERKLLSGILDIAENSEVPEFRVRARQFRQRFSAGC